MVGGCKLLPGALSTTFNLVVLLYHICGPEIIPSPVLW